MALTGGAASWYGASALLGRLAGEQFFSLPEFRAAEFEFTDEIDATASELVLDTVHCVDDGDEDELLLEDALPLAPATSQVIRLFDPAQMPSAGELYERIDRHLASGPRAVPDSTQELHAALSALRQTLR